jgi:hypothetical protein
MCVRDCLLLQVIAGCFACTGSPALAAWPFSRLHACVQPDDCGQPADYDDDDDDGESRLKRACRCFCPGEPPRGEVAIALPARLSTEFAREVRETDRESARESALAATIDQRVEVLEKDLTRLTLIVEKLADNQKRDSADLTRLTLAVEGIATAQKQGREDLTRMSVILEKLATQPPRGGN